MPKIGFLYVGVDLEDNLVGFNVRIDVAGGLSSDDVLAQEADAGTHRLCDRVTDSTGVTVDLRCGGVEKTATGECVVDEVVEPGRHNRFEPLQSRFETHRCVENRPGEAVASGVDGRQLQFFL